MIDTDKYEWDSKCRMVVIDGELYRRGSNGDYHLSLHDEAVAQIVADAPLLLEEVKRLREEVKVLSKYRDIVIEFDDALLADGDTDIRWSAIYDERVFE